MGHLREEQTRSIPGVLLGKNGGPSDLTRLTLCRTRGVLTLKRGWEYALFFYEKKRKPSKQWVCWKYEELRE